MSNGLCQGRCQGIAVFAVILGNDCYCSDLAPATQVDPSLCNTPCPGYPFDSCGNVAQTLYAYFNLGQRPSGTGLVLTAASTAVTLSVASVITTSSPITESPSTETGLAAGATTPSEQSTSTAVSTSSTGASSFTSTDTSDIALYIQTAIPASDRSQSSNACFLNSAYSYYSTPTWYDAWPSQVQSYYSASNQGATAACTLSASQLNANAATRRSSGLSGGAIAGIVVGVIIGVLIIAALLFLCIRRRRRTRTVAHNKADLEHEKAAMPSNRYTNPDHYPTSVYSDEDLTALPAAPPTAPPTALPTALPTAHMQTTTHPAFIGAAQGLHKDTTHPAFVGAAQGHHKDNSIQSTPSTSEASRVEQGPSRPWLNYSNQRARSEMSEDQQFFPALQQQNPYQLDPDLDFNGSGQGHMIPRKPVGGHGQAVHPGGGAGGFGHFSDTAGYEDGEERSWYHAR